MGLFSTGHKAEKEAKGFEADRQRQLTDSTGRVNAIFDDPRREAQRQSFLSGMRGRLQDGVARQATDAQRELKFALARGGLNQGSVDVDSGRTLQDENARAVLGAEDTAFNAYSDLLGRDESERGRLLDLTTRGVDTGKAAAQAAGMMGARMGAAGETLVPGMVQDAFSGVGSVLKKRKEADAMARGAASVSSPWGTV